MSNSLNIGRIKEFHFDLEPTFGDGVTQSAATLIQALEGSSMELQKRERHDNPAANGTRDPSDPIVGRYQEAPFTIECHALMQPDASTVSPLENLVMAALGTTSSRVTPNDQTVLIGSSKSVIKVTDASGYNLFDGVVIDDAIAFVTKVDTVANAITIAPPLLVTPTVSSAIGKTNTYHLADEQPTVGIDVKYDWMTIRGAGGSIQSINFETSGKEPVKIKLSGAISTQVMTSRATLASAVASGAITIFTVDNIHAFEAGSLFDIGTETGILVTAVDSTLNQLTVVRGASPVAHSSGAVINPSWLNGSVAGSPAHGRSGRALRGVTGGTAVSIPAVSRSFNLETGATLINDEDGAERPTYSVGGPRKVSGSRTLHLRELDVQWLRSGQKDEYQPELYEMSAGSRRMAIFMPRVSLKIPSLNEGTTRDLSQEFDAAHAQDADGNEIGNRVVVIATC